MKTRAFFVVTSLLLACGKPEVPARVFETPPANYPAFTSVTPPAGLFLGTVALVLETSRPATIFMTQDGSDPREAGSTRVSGPSPLTLELSRTATIRYFSRTPEGLDESLQDATYVRAGGPAGTISGEVVVGKLATGKSVGLSVNGQSRLLGRPLIPGALPFSLSELSSGTYRLVAISDRNDDGNFWPFVDDSSEPATVELDLNDLVSASAEGIRLYLWSSPEGLASIEGTVELPVPTDGQNLTVSALSPDVLSQGGDPNAVLDQLRRGYQVVTRASQTSYPYAITHLEPGRYIPVPALMGFGRGGLALNLIANPLKMQTLSAGKIGHADFAYGPVSISGTVTVVPGAPPSGLVYGVVAGRHASLSGLQAVLMPTVLFPLMGTATLSGNYAGQSLRENVTFQIRVFTNLDGTDPLAASLAWVLNPTAPEPPHVSVPLGTTDLVQDIAVP